MTNEGTYCFDKQKNEILIETPSFATVFLCYFREVIVHKKAREIL